MKHLIIIVALLPSRVSPWYITFLLSLLMWSELVDQCTYCKHQRNIPLRYSGSKTFAAMKQTYILQNLNSMVNCCNFVLSIYYLFIYFFLLFYLFYCINAMLLLLLLIFFYLSFYHHYFFYVRCEHIICLSVKNLWTFLCNSVNLIAQKSSHSLSRHHCFINNNCDMYHRRKRQMWQ